MPPRIGLTGWLDPQGVFHPCEYGKHNEFAMEIVDSYGAYEQLKTQFYIPMGADFDEDKSYVFINIDHDKLEPLITDEQKKWFDDNFERLAKGQQQMVSDWLYDE